MVELMAIAKELSRMRLIAQTTEYPRDLAQSYAECLLLEKYDKLPSMLDLRRDSKRKVTLIPKDEKGAAIRVVTGNLFPFRVYKPWLHAEILVFIKSGSPVQTSKILGWLTSELVSAMPQQPIRDRPDDHCYVVEGGFLIDMPTTFEFTEPKHHVEDMWHGIWSYQGGGWECCTCGRLIPDPRTRATVEKEES